VAPVLHLQKKEMRTSLIATVLVLFLTTALHAQPATEKIFAFKITDYIERSNDSIAIVQVIQQDAWPVLIKDKQLGLLQHCYQSGGPKDTGRIGWGRCHLIKGDYYYFGIHLDKGQKPKAGDLLYTKVNAQFAHDGVLLNVMKHAIEFSDVTGKGFMFSSDIFRQTAQEEAAVLDSMVADIRYTGKAMLEQMPEQNQTVKGGQYDGKKLFVAMQGATRSELVEFLKYITARPRLYAGNNWKISEVFATWMVSETPRVVQ
jgi:hypothetical protein